MSLIGVIQIIACFIAIVLVVLIAKKIYYRFVLKKTFYLIPRLSTKGIANVGIILAMSIAVIILLIFVTADIASVFFRLWAGTRIILESVLIKIGGLLFGPIIGMALGAAIDFLCVALTAGVFHIGYFVTAIMFGLIGGIIRFLLTSKLNSGLYFSIWSSLITILITAIAIIILFFNNDGQSKYLITFLFIKIELTKLQIIAIFIASVLLALIILWGSYFINIYQLRSKKTKKNWFVIFAPVFMTIILSEIVCNIMIIPVFDEMLSPLNYSTWLAIRLLLFIPMVLINIAIILPIYIIINKNVTYNYEDDTIGELSTSKKYGDKHLFKNWWNKVKHRSINKEE